MNGYEVIITNPHVGPYWGVVQRVGGVPFIHFVSTDKAECEQWLADRLKNYAVWEVAKYLRTSVESVIKAVKATGVMGQMVGGMRVWSGAEVERLAVHINQNRAA